MARELRVKFVGDTTGLTTAQAEAIDKLKGLGTASIAVAGESKAAWTEMEARVKEIGPELGGLADAAFKAGDALNRAGDAKTIPQLTSRLKEAQIAVDALRAKYEAVEAAGGTIDDKAVAALANMQTSVVALKGKLDDMRAASEAAERKLAEIGNEPTKSLSAMEAAAKRAADAAKLLADAQGPEQMNEGINKASFAIVDLREKIKAAAAAGETIDDKAVEALKRLEAETGAAASKVAQAQKALDEIKATGAAAGDKFDVLSQSAGGLDGAFERMRKSGDGATKVIGTLGAGIGVASVAITGAISAGKELADGIDKLSEKYAKFQQKQIDQQLKAQEQAVALRAADRGLIEHGKTIDQTVENYRKYAVAQGNLSEQSRKWIETVAGLKIPPTYEDLAGKVKAIGIAFEGAGKKGEEYANRFLVENGEALTELAQKYKDTGKAVPEEIQKLIDKLDAMRAAGEAATAAMGQTAQSTMTLKDAVNNTDPAFQALANAIMDSSSAIRVGEEVNAKYAAQLDQTGAAVDALTAKVNAQREAQAAANDFTSRAPSHFKDIQDAAVGAAVAAGKFGDDLDRVADVVVKTGGTMTVGAPMFFQIAKASDAARESIDGLIDSMHRLNKASESVFDKAPGWQDYLVALREGFNSGITSLTTYISQLNAFEWQLNQLFAGAGADAKAAIAEVIAAIDALKDAAMSGKDGGGSMSLDQLAALADSIFGKNK